MSSPDPENLPPSTHPEGVSAKSRAFLVDFFSDPAIIFVLISDPLIFMTPEHLGVEGNEHVDLMHDVVLGQAFAGVASRTVASYLHVNHPDYAHIEFMDKLPLRISGYAHGFLGAVLASAGQGREATIALSLGVGNLQLTGDLNRAVKAIDSCMPSQYMPTIFNAYKSPNAHFAVAEFAILLPAMQAFADALNKGDANVDLLVKLLPAVPLIVAARYIGRNVIADERVNAEFRREGSGSIAIHNEGYPVMLVGATGATAGGIGLAGLASKGSLVNAFNDLGAGVLNAFHQYGAVAWGTVSNDNYVPALYQIGNAQDAYVAAVCTASITVGAAYVMLENKFGTFFQPGRPVRTVIPAEDSPEP